MRRAIMRALIAGHTWFIFHVARVLNPAWNMPTMARFWFRTAEDTHKFRAWVVFTHAPDRYSQYHVQIVLSRWGDYWVINPATRLMVAPIPCAERYINSLHPLFVAQTELPKGWMDGWMLSEGYSCVTLCRSVLGIFDPLVQTPEQLLCELWRRRA